jgi:hypothetical protein
MMDVSIILVTSPSASIPSTSITNYVIKSFGLLDGLEGVPIKIVFDGFKLASENRYKKGRITEQSKNLYDKYFQNLQIDWKEHPNVELIRAPEHLGFAHCVKLGLEACTTTFALITQHDRCFLQSFAYLQQLLTAMEEDESIRYIGFPTSKNYTHDRLITSSYQLSCLNYNPIIKREIIPNYLYLQPLIFWFDSQHLCHIERYLRIFLPFKTFPQEFRDIFGSKPLEDMCLRKGDFIEDKFGQQQRNLFIMAKEKKCSDDVIIRLFQWYGSYLCWIDENVSYDENLQHELSPSNPINIMVRHLHGREFNVERFLEYVKAHGIERMNPNYIEVLGVDFIQQSCDGSVEETKGKSNLSNEDKLLDSP